MKFYVQRNNVVILINQIKSKSSFIVKESNGVVRWRLESVWSKDSILKGIYLFTICLESSWLYSQLEHINWWFLAAFDSGNDVDLPILARVHLSNKIYKINLTFVTSLTNTLLSLNFFTVKYKIHVVLIFIL